MLSVDTLLLCHDALNRRKAQVRREFADVDCETRENLDAAIHEVHQAIAAALAKDKQA
jgi:hypothetical protein